MAGFVFLHETELNMGKVKSISIFYTEDRDFATVEFHYEDGRKRQLTDNESIFFMELVDTESKRTDIRFPDPSSVRNHVANTYFH